jgi:hypothetical protein
MLSSYKLSHCRRVMQQTKLPARILVASSFTLPADRGAIALTGRVFGHAGFANGTAIVTSPLCSSYAPRLPILLTEHCGLRIVRGASRSHRGVPRARLIPVFTFVALLF